MTLIDNSFLVPVGFDGGESGAPSGEGGGDSSGGAQPAPDSSGGGSQGGSDSSDALAKLEEQRRSFQSRAEKAESAQAALAQRLEALEKRLSGGGGDDGGEQALDPDALAESIQQRLERRAAMKEAAKAVSDEFGYADPAILSKATEFESPEALREAAEQSHKRVSDLIEAEVAKQREAILEQVAREYGVRLAPPSTKGDQGTGEMTLERFRSLSFAEQAKFEQEHPEVVDRLLRSAI